MNVPFLPTLNACLNLTAGILLFSGWQAIRNKKSAVHKKLMVAALTASFLFLVSYLTYHLTTTGVTRYQGDGLIRGVYFFILLTHTPLAVIIVPSSLWAVYFALRGDFARHVRITKWLLPVWMYVSATGVLIYLMLYIF